jgi:hypothetical protein
MRFPFSIEEEWHYLHIMIAEGFVPGRVWQDYLLENSAAFEFGIGMRSVF